MANFKEHIKNGSVKLLVSADSGAGKTASLASLANSGFKVRVIDFDNGLDVLGAQLTEKGMENLDFITLQDDTVDHSSGISAWAKFLKVLQDGWPDGDLGKIQEWDNNTFLVIDTLNHMAKAAMRHSLKKAGKKPDDQPSLPDYGDAGRRVESRIAWLCSKSVPCNVIFNTHIKSVEDEYGRAKDYPMTIGTAVSKDIASYFNNHIRIDVKKVDKSGQAERVFRTSSDNRMNLKTSAPETVDVEEPFHLWGEGPGLAELIAKIKQAASGKK